MDLLLTATLCISGGHNSESKCRYDAEPSAYYFYVKTKISIDFQICIRLSDVKNLDLFVASSCYVNWIISYQFGLFKGSGRLQEVKEHEKYGENLPRASAFNR